MKVLLNHPVRELDIPGPKRVKDLLKELALLPESVLVVRGDDLVTEDDTLRDNDRVEIRPVMSGGQGKSGRLGGARAGGCNEKRLRPTGEKPVGVPIAHLMQWAMAWDWVGDMAEPGRAGEMGRSRGTRCSGSATGL